MIVNYANPNVTAVLRFQAFTGIIKQKKPRIGAFSLKRERLLINSRIDQLSTSPVS
jgi:hypothetical protein